MLARQQVDQEIHAQADHHECDVNQPLHQRVDLKGAQSDHAVLKQRVGKAHQPAGDILVEHEQMVGVKEILNIVALEDPVKAVGEGSQEKYEEVVGCESDGKVLDGFQSDGLEDPQNQA